MICRKCCITPVEIVKQFLIGKHIIIKESGFDKKDLIVKDIKKDIDWDWIGFAIETTDGRKISLEIDDPIWII